MWNTIRDTCGINALVSFAPPGLVRSSVLLTHGLRRGLHSFAAPRLHLRHLPPPDYSTTLKRGLAGSRANRHHFPRAALRADLSFEQVPGFFELGVAGVGAVRVEEDVGASVGGGDGEDVPGTGRNNISRDEVDLVAAVGDSVGVEVAAVGVPAFLPGTFDLDADEVSVALDRKVIGGVVAPRLGDAESELGGSGHETQFGPLAARLGVADGHTRIFHSLRSQGVEATKNAAPDRPRFFFTLYFYFINSAGVKWTFAEKYISHWRNSLRRNVIVRGLDKNLGFSRGSVPFRTRFGRDHRSFGYEAAAWQAPKRNIRSLDFARDDTSCFVVSACGAWTIALVGLLRARRS